MCANRKPAAIYTAIMEVDLACRRRCNINKGEIGRRKVRLVSDPLSDGADFVRSLFYRILTIEEALMPVER